MCEFKTYHPLINFTYFVLIIGISCFLLHPICLIISLVCGAVYAGMLRGRRSMLYLLPMLIVTALLNPLFNHQGITILTYLPDGNPLTLESMIYGVCAGGMVASVICHFSNFHVVMTSDKLLCLFGKIIPSLALIFSMTLRFVPHFIEQFKRVSQAQKHLRRDVPRIKHALSVFSIVITYALEHSVETADSMKARGFGITKRTAFSPQRLSVRDFKALLLLSFLGAYTLIGVFMGALKFDFFPLIRWSNFSVYSFSVFLAYLLFCSYPIILDLREVRKWETLNSKT